MLNTIIEPIASSSCPICGIDTPHVHNLIEQGQYTKIQRLNARVVELEAELASLKSQGIVAQQCDVCHGTGKCNDADFGDICYNEWDCPKCKKALDKSNKEDV